MNRDDTFGILRLAVADIEEPNAIGLLDVAGH